MKPKWNSIKNDKKTDDMDIYKREVGSLSKPQPDLNTTVGFDMKMTLQTPPHPPTTHRNSMSAISYLLLTRF